MAKGGGCGGRKCEANEDDSRRQSRDSCAIGDDESNCSRGRSYSDVALRGGNGGLSVNQPIVAQSRQQQQQQHPLTRRQQAQNMPKKQEVNLALTLVSISLLFIVCQSVKLIADVYELVCEKVSWEF